MKTARVKSRFHTVKVTLCVVFLASVVFYSLAHMDKAPKWSSTPAGSTSSATASPHHR